MQLGNHDGEAVSVNLNPGAMLALMHHPCIALFELGQHIKKKLLKVHAAAGLYYVAVHADTSMLLAPAASVSVAVAHTSAVEPYGPSA